MTHCCRVCLTPGRRLVTGRLGPPAPVIPTLSRATRPGRPRPSRLDGVRQTRHDMPQTPSQLGSQPLTALPRPGLKTPEGWESLAAWVAALGAVPMAVLRRHRRAGERLACSWSTFPRCRPAIRLRRTTDRGIQLTSPQPPAVRRRLLSPLAADRNMCLSRSFWSLVLQTGGSHE